MPPKPAAGAPKAVNAPNKAATGADATKKGATGTGNALKATTNANKQAATGAGTGATKGMDASKPAGKTGGATKGKTGGGTKAPAGKPHGRRYKDGYWTGSSKLFKPHGKGTYTYDNGDVYVGMCHSGLRNTEKNGPEKIAKMTFANGAMFKGEFLKGRLNNAGRITFPDGGGRNVRYDKDVAHIEALVQADGTSYTGGLWRWMRSGKGKIQFDSGDSYEGDFKKDRLEGTGTYHCSSGDFYTGGFEGGWHGRLGERGEKGPGHGVCTFPEGDVYMGGFQDGLPHGEGVLRFVDGDSVAASFDMGRWEGSHTYANGDTYAGPFFLNLPSGEGELRFAGGNVYQGSFEGGEFFFAKEDAGMGLVEKGTFARGRLQGKGLRIAGAEKYEGSFEQGLYHGEGVLEMLDTGLRYEGQFASGRFHGKGRLEYGKAPAGVRVAHYPCTAMRNCRVQPDDSIYEGRWRDGQRGGRGWFECDLETYEGEFVDDMYDGKGEWICLVDVTAWGDTSNYVGEFYKGKRHGQGEYTSEIGYTYQGSWKDGMKHGTAPPGDSGTYVGDFVLDQRHGNGTMRYDSGGVYAGDWKVGKRQGRGREVFVSGARYEGEYYNDQMNGEGTYDAPPVGRDERIKAYKRRILIEAERGLVDVDAALDDGRPDLAKKLLVVAQGLFDQAGCMTPPRPLSAKALKVKLDIGYVGSVTDVVARATVEAKRKEELKVVAERIEAAEQAVIESEDLDPTLKKLREEREFQAQMDKFKTQKVEDEKEKAREMERKKKAEEIALARMEAKKQQMIKDMEKANKAKGIKGPVKLPRVMPERVAREKKIEMEKAIEELKAQEAKAESDAIGASKQSEADAYEEQVRELSNGTYTGQFLDGLRHGNGTRVYGNGDKYDGLWREGKRHGHGRLTFANGTMYVGPFHMGQYHGKGVLKSANSVFEGMFVNGKMEGFGVQKMADGSVFEGEYWDGRPHGKGLRKFKSGAEYRGDFRWGCFDGEGEYLYDDGSTYRGFWKADMRDGFGVWEQSGGDRFSGLWLKDVALNGKGVRINRLTGSVYAGDISNGTFHGYGFFRDGENGEVYEGWWEKGKRQGVGVSEGHEDTGGRGSRFEGDWVEGRPLKGFGKIVYRDGSWYVGQILKVYRHGSGVMSYANGDVYDGDWRSDLQHGWGCMVKMRRVYTGEWHFGEVGAETPVWEPFEDDSYVDFEVDSDALVRASQALGCSPHRTKVVVLRSQRPALRGLARGSMRSIREAWDMIKGEENSLLVASQGPKHTHPPNLAQDLQALRERGSALLAQARGLIDQRAWDVLGAEAQEVVERVRHVRECVTSLRGRVGYTSLPSIITWAKPAPPSRLPQLRPSPRRGPPLERFGGLLILDAEAVAPQEGTASQGRFVGDTGSPARRAGGGFDPGELEDGEDTPMLGGVFGETHAWGIGRGVAREGDSRGSEQGALPRGGSAGGGRDVTTGWGTVEGVGEGTPLGLAIPEEVGEGGGGEAVVAGAFGETHRWGTGAGGGGGEATIRERRKKKVRICQRSNRSNPSVVTWTLHGVHPRRPYLPSVATWNNHDASPVGRIVPPGYWRVRLVANTPLGRAPRPLNPDHFLDCVERVAGLVGAGLLSRRDQRLFEILGCPPGVDPLVWSQHPRELRPQAWRRWRETHDAWKLTSTPSCATWAGGGVGVGGFVRPLPGGMLGGEQAYALAGISRGAQHGEGGGGKGISEEVKGLAMLYLGESRLEFDA